jgi:hypothetical protein
LLLLNYLSFNFSGQRTWNSKMSKEVVVIGSDDKCQITGMLSVKASGTLLPMQLVFKGVLLRSLPGEGIRHEMEREGHIFSLNQKNHWSSEKTMKEFVVRVLQPYHKRVCLKKNIPVTVKLVWLID